MPRPGARPPFGRSRGRRSQTVVADCLTVCHPRDRTNLTGTPVLCAVCAVATNGICPRSRQTASIAWPSHSCDYCLPLLIKTISCRGGADFLKLFNSYIKSIALPSHSIVLIFCSNLNKTCTEMVNQFEQDSSWIGEPISTRRVLHW